jgi:ABC-type dipeptide/oligopeptide/nickel transport system ATPase subunit
MPSFDIIREVETVNSFRVSGIMDMFDIKSQDSIKEKFSGAIDIEDKNWNIGVIVGGSGTGKSTIGKEVFGDWYFNGFEYKSSAVVDDMPKDRTLKEISEAFFSVGFGSPPSWLKPYSVLSCGEKMRTDLARSILEKKDVIVFDEFTSVVDRDVAKMGSYALSKAIRRANKKFIAISCHADIIEWIEPDWIFSTDSMQFFFVQKNIQDQQSSLNYGHCQPQKVGVCGKFLKNIII